MAQYFILINNLAIVINSLDVMRTGLVSIPPILRLGLIAGCLFICLLEMFRQLIDTFFHSKKHWFRMRNTAFLLIFFTGVGFFWAYMTLLVDPSLNKSAPATEPHRFYNSRKCIT